MPHQNSSEILTATVVKLSLAHRVEDVTPIAAEAARALTGADGTTFVLRDSGKCFYADENAISPLWKGMRFPMEACISGWSMLNKQVVLIKDIYADSRIPHDAYRPTFVKSLCMIPIRHEDPIGAIGVYWAKEHTPTVEDIKLLQVLADNTAVVLENLELKKSIFDYNNREQAQARELELAIHSFAHDLRTPIAAMTGLAELIKMRSEGGDLKIIRYAECIYEAGIKTAGQIEKMLSLYRATSGQIQKQVVDLNSMANAVVTDFSYQYKDHQVDATIEPNLKAVADPVLVKLVLENLFSNAIKYSSKTPVSKIHFGNLKRESDFSTFFIQDNGVGFDPSMAGKLFQPLSRLHTSTEFAGTGLGLASVAKIIELHGGKVRADSTPNVNTTFYFSLPAVA